MPVHPTAIVHESAQVDPSAEIGPFCIVGEGVSIGARTRLIAHVSAEGLLTVGEDNVFHPYATIGVAPQDLKYEGEASATRIGDRNQFREFVTVHRGTRGGGMVTSIGSDNLVQAYGHVAHDCIVGSHSILAHGCTLGGHVTVEDYAVVGAWSGVHQFCRVGAHCYIGGYSVITQDALPFSTVVTPREAKTYSVNKTGLERRGFSAEEIQSLHKSVRILTKAGLNTEQALKRIESEVEPNPHVERLLEFIRTSERGFIK